MAKKKKIKYKAQIKVDAHTITRVVRQPKAKKKDLSRLKDQRKKLYDRKSYWNKEWQEAKTKKRANAALKRLIAIQKKLNEVNNKLGVTYELPKVPKKKLRIVQGQRIEVLNIWEGLDKIKEIIKKRQYKTFFIDGKKYSYKFPTRIMNAYDRLETLSMQVPRGTPRVEFTYDIKARTVSIAIF